MTPTPELTTKKLARIIEAQVAGGCKKYINFTRNSSWLSDDQQGYTHSSLHPEWVSILDILLDPQGLRAGYPDNHQVAGPHPAEEIGVKIFQTWFRSFGDAVGAIETAFSLLP